MLKSFCHLLFFITFVMLLTNGHPAAARNYKHHAEQQDSTQSTSLTATGTLEVAFSPNEGSEHLLTLPMAKARGFSVYLGA